MKLPEETTIDLCPSSLNWIQKIWITFILYKCIQTTLHQHQLCHRIQKNPIIKLHLPYKTLTTKSHLTAQVSHRRDIGTPCILVSLTYVCIPVYIQPMSASLYLQPMPASLHLQQMSASLYLQSMPTSNGECHMTLLARQRAATSDAALGYRPMIVPKMADQLAASWQSRLDVSETMLCDDPWLDTSRQESAPRSFGTVCNLPRRFGNAESA